jgi:XRE family transcriptional regulator, aerobic/anaerobic benzoate catabolism transcriptional regulator
MQYSAYGERAKRPRAKLLRGLGAAVRARRTDLGLTMRALAKLASVSERFLAQLEAGEGNISVARLEDVAEALGTTGAELLASATERRADARKVVALVGLRGAGKSTVGASLARRLGVPFVELDAEIAREAQMTLSTLFEIHGERYYRAIERELLSTLLAKDEPMVVATGGSIVTDPENWAMLRSRARTVWLKATPDEHWRRVVAQGDVRPMRDRPRAKNELRQLLAARAPLYEQSDLELDTARRSVEELVQALVHAAG